MAFLSDTGKLFSNVQMLLELFKRCNVVQSGLDLPIGYIDLSLGPQGPRGHPVTRAPIQ